MQSSRLMQMQVVERTRSEGWLSREEKRKKKIILRRKRKEKLLRQHAKSGIKTFISLQIFSSY